MFHRKASSPAYNSQQKLRETASAKLGSAKFVKSQEFPLIPPGFSSMIDRFCQEEKENVFRFSFSMTVPEEAALRYFQLNKQGKRQSDLIKLIRKKRFYPIAPDGKTFRCESSFFRRRKSKIHFLALIPNSSCRQIFEKPEEETSEVKLFKLRLVIKKKVDVKIFDIDTILLFLIFFFLRIFSTIFQ